MPYRATLPVRSKRGAVHVIAESMLSRETLAKTVLLHLHRTENDSMTSEARNRGPTSSPSGASDGNR